MVEKPSEEDWQPFIQAYREKAGVEMERCESCKWWDDGSGEYNNGTPICCNDGCPAFRSIDPVPPDFGCVLWEKKDDS